jgi:acetoin utilization deacetylase AcuC-like enzyme
MSEPRLFYSPRYELRFGEHVFPVEKYRRLRDRLVAEGVARPSDFAEPHRATDDELLRVHTRAYLDRLVEMCAEPESGLTEFEAPITEEILEAVRFAVGGTIEATRAAARGGLGINLAGGFHHAFSDRGEGFCFLNDVAVAIRDAQAAGLARRFFVLDGDLHQGNGTARIFAGDRDVFTFSIHQENLYPRKERSSLDVGLPDEAGDDEYLGALAAVVPAAMGAHQPDVVVYLAGADPFEEDQLGSLRLTKAGLERRDALAFEWAKRFAGGRLAIVLAGGYARRADDVVDIHFRMVRAARRSFAG